MTRLSPRPIPSRPEQSESAYIPPRPVWRADLEHLILSSPPPTRSPARGQTRGHDERHDAHSLGSGQSTRRSAPSTPAPAPRRLAAPPRARASWEWGSWHTLHRHALPQLIGVRLLFWHNVAVSDFADCQ